MRLKVTGVRGGGKQIEVEAFVLPKVTVNLPTVPVSPVNRWKHLLDLEFADSDHGFPARVDILLGGKVFSKEVVYGQRFGTEWRGEMRGSTEFDSHLRCLPQHYF